MITRRHLLCATAGLVSAALSGHAAAQVFDHGHAAWTVLLKKHVLLLDGGKASQLRYAGMVADQSALNAYLATLSGVSQGSFNAFSAAQQKAFLINAYNAFTVKLILTRYPKLDSIKDLGTLLQNPWKQKFVPLLGATVSLDAIEHEMLRVRGRFDDPRVHFAVNCASVGCPMLREESYVAERLDAQLDEQAMRFVGDRSRNRWNPATQKLEVSKIFDWYGEDFRLGHRGIASLAGFFGRYADLLADSPVDRERVRAGKAAIGFLDYDWKLNGAPR